MAHRKKPFTVKKKKAQLQEKRARKRAEQGEQDDQEKKELAKFVTGEGHVVDSDGEENEEMTGEYSIHLGARSNQNQKLNTVFEKESKASIQLRVRQASSKVIKPIVDNMFDANRGEAIPFPLRPKWDYSFSRERLEKQEEQAFKDYLKHIYSTYPRSRLNYFDHNIEVWRQLWRVLEMSDVVIIVTDVRYPLFHFPIALFNYVVKVLDLPFICVFNKIDLVTRSVVNAWTKYFEETFKGIHIVEFTTFPEEGVTGNGVRRGQTPRNYAHGYGATGLARKLASLNLGRSVDWTALAKDDFEEDEEITDEMLDQIAESEARAAYQGSHVGQRNKDRVTLGLVGHPNVGKSTLLNAVMKKKVVSVSATPGHTKHFQTIHIGHEIQLCDCPGLIFPALDMPKSLQISCGLFPVAQLQEPYTSVEFIAERLPLVKTLKIKHTLTDEYTEDQWTAWDICEEYAVKRGYYTNKRGRPNVHRAAHEILRDVIVGRSVILSIKPPNFIEGQEEAKEALLKAAEAEEQEGMYLGEDLSEHEEEDEEESEEDSDESDTPIAATNPFSLLMSQ